MRKLLLLLWMGGFLVGYSQTETDTLSGENHIITLSQEDLSNDEESQDVSSLLQGSRDIFVNTAGYTFGALRFRMRGYNSENNEVLINGIQMNDAERGSVYWSLWGGLNDAVRYKIYANGLNSALFSFGNIGGSTYISTRASQYRKGVSASYAISNRSYRNRIMLSYATGLMDNGWAFMGTVSKRWAQEGYIEGTSYDAYAYFLSAEKKINKKHSIGLTFFGSPSIRGKAGGSVQEAYDLLDDNFYNPYWGYQNGEKRNSRVTHSHKPQIILTHYHNPTENTKVTTSLAYGFGTYATTALDWYNTRDPRPDYYRNLPSYYDDPTASEAVADAFIENHQLDWDYFYKINKGNENGRSSYILEDRKTDYSEAKANMIINHKLTDNYFIDGGLYYNYYKGRHYKEIYDLLGGQYYLDIDKYAERDFPDDPNMIDNDLNKDEVKVTEGDVFGYDYDMNKRDYGAWIQWRAELSKIDYFVSAKLNEISFWRTGHMRNGKFPDNSYGDSPKNNFFNYNLKAGITYKLNGRNYLYADGFYGTRAPFIRNSFISPRTRDFTVDNLENETITSFEAGYILRTPIVKGRLTAYYTKFENQTEVYSFYNDLFNSFTNQIITGKDLQNMGIEFGAEAKVSPTVTASAVVALSDNIYSDRAMGVVIQDNDARQLAEPSTLFIKNYYQGNGPQEAYSLGLKYNSPKYWFVSLKANYFANRYLPINPARRTTEAVSNETGSDHVEPGSDLWHAILDQEKLPDAFTLDFFGGKSWKIKDYYIYINASVNNLLNNKDMITGGYEQRRFDYKHRDPDKFPPKYFYGYGTNYFISLGVRF